MTARRSFLLGAAAALCTPARADSTWPRRPLRLLVAYAPGGLSDDVTRLLAERLALRLGVPVFVENRAGAGGSLAMAALARVVAVLGSRPVTAKGSNTLLMALRS